MQFAIGETVEHTGRGKIKAGYTGVVADRWIQNGYTYYVLEGSPMVHRQKDLKKVSEV